MLLPVDVDGPVGPHVPLDGYYRALRVHDGLTLRELADEPLALLGECDYGRSRPHPFGVGDNRDVVALLNGDAAVRCSKIDSYHFRHKTFTSSSSNTGFRRPSFAERTR